MLKLEQYVLATKFLSLPQPSSAKQVQIGLDFLHLLIGKQFPFMTRQRTFTNPCHFFNFCIRVCF